MSELKPDSEKKEERLSDKEKVNTEKINEDGQAYLYWGNPWVIFVL